jgi:DNA-binding PadR family transcriptional regulator
MSRTRTHRKPERRVVRRAHPGTDIRALAGNEQLILRLLREYGETYGMRLVALSDGRLMQRSVYVTLSRMEEKGYVDSWEMRLKGNLGGVRRVYRPTAHGLRMLEAQEAFALAVAESARRA